MHLQEDLPDYLNGLEKLERNVEEYRKDVEEFIDSKIPELVTNYLRQNLSMLTISNNRTEVEPMNSISLPRLLSWLNDYWLHGRDFDVHYYDNNFNYQGTNIATIPAELETRLRAMTTALQNHFEINSEIRTLRVRGEKLVERAEVLSTDINNAIVFPIDRKTYSTKCRGCP
jgi:hypothetical protein